MFTLIITHYDTGYHDVVSCEDWNEARDTFLVNFYDAENLPIPSHDGLIISELIARGYSISFEV